MLQHDEQQFVFVATGESTFQRVDVVADDSAGQQVAILSGLEAGQQVVAHGAFILKSELLLEREDGGLRETAWRNAVALSTSNPGLTLVLTLAILVMAVVSTLFPSLWLVVVVILFALVCVNAILDLLGLRGHPR